MTNYTIPRWFFWTCFFLAMGMGAMFYMMLVNPIGDTSIDTEVLKHICQQNIDLTNIVNDESMFIKRITGKNMTFISQLSYCLEMVK